MEGARHRVAIVTGAASGIGAGTSIAFAKEGLSVVLVDMNADLLGKVADKMRTMGVSPDKILIITADLSQVSSFESIINQTITKFGQIDVLVNNAGFCKMTPFENLTMEYFDREYQVMLRAPLFLSQKAFPHLKKTKGCIVNVSSVASKSPAAGMIDYSAIKAGLEHLTRGLALEGGTHGIRVNSVHPGVVRTAIFDDCPYGDMLFEMAKNVTLLGRVGTVEDIASSIMYLTAESASFITGANLVLDGGALLCGGKPPQK